MTQAGHAGGHCVLADFNSGALTCWASRATSRRGWPRRVEALLVPIVGGVDMSPKISSEAMLRVPDVLDRVGVSRRTLCRWRADGTFPQALRLGANSIGWPGHVVDEWLANRPPAGP